jgi:flavin prenyltransferase
MHTPKHPHRILLAVTGASGILYAYRLAKALSERTELHLIISEAALTVIKAETDLTPHDLMDLAHTTHDPNDITAPPASGSWIHQGMVLCPCSMASLSAVARGLGSSLIHRCADVTLKEGRTLVLVPRETPLNTIHLENMLAAARAGAAILPACPGFYHRPRTLEDLADHLAGKILDRLGIDHELFSRWSGG